MAATGHQGTQRTRAMRNRAGVAAFVSGLLLLAPAGPSLAEGRPTDAGATTTPAEDAAPILVIPAGRDAQIARLVGADKELPGGCRLDSAMVEVRVVRATYRCDGKEDPAVLVLRAPDPAQPALLRTAHFRVTGGPAAPAPLVAWLGANLRAHEESWTWAHARSEGAFAREEKAEPPDLPPVDPGFLRRYHEVDTLYRQARHEEALAIALALARENPRYGGVLAMVVGNLAPQPPDAAGVAELTAAADAHPDDPLAQFVAAIAAHYSGHTRARTREEKERLYRTSIRYLARTRPAYDFEPRVYIYLAVSHFRLGHQDQAEAYIEQALTLARQDPDAYYCRAEIFQRKNPTRALEDLEHYVQIMSGPEHVSMGDKKKRVAAMRARLQARIRGEHDDEELWDPLGSQ